MPIEIREIIIKTEVRQGVPNNNLLTQKEDLNKLRNQLLQECKKMIKSNLKKNSNRR